MRRLGFEHDAPRNYLRRGMASVRRAAFVLWQDFAGATSRNVAARIRSGLARVERVREDLVGVADALFRGVVERFRAPATAGSAAKSAVGCASAARSANTHQLR